MGIIAAAMIAAHSMGLGMGINSINDLPDWVAFRVSPPSHSAPCPEVGK